MFPVRADSMAGQPLILLVEDLDDDVFMIRYALRQTHVTNPIEVARDGEEARAYLKRAGNYADGGSHPLPGLVLLDLKMPRMDGFELLQWIRQEPRFNLLPVVVLTSSLDAHDADAACAAGASSVLVKPSDFHETLRLMADLAAKWLSPATNSHPPLIPAPVCTAWRTDSVTWFKARSLVSLRAASTFYFAEARSRVHFTSFVRSLILKR